MVRFATFYALIGQYSEWIYTLSCDWLPPGLRQAAEIFLLDKSLLNNLDSDLMIFTGKSLEICFALSVRSTHLYS